MANNTTKKSILFINYRSDIGGGSAIMYSIINGLDSNVFKIHVFCGAEQPFINNYKDLEISGHITLVPINIKKINLLNYMLLVKYIKKYKIELMHSHGKGAGIWSRLLAIFTHIPVLHTFHGLHFKNYSLLKKRVYFAIERILSLFTYKHISVSISEEKVALANKFSNASKSVVISNGIDMRKYKIKSISETNKAKQDLGIDNNIIVIGCIARFSVPKNIKFMLDCIKCLSQKCSNFNFLLAGKEEDFTFDDLKLYVNELSIDSYVKLLDGGTEIQRCFHAIDIYLITSLWEGLPTTILEASAIGIPIVASKVTGNVDAMIDGKTGFLIDISNNDINRFADALHKLIMSSELRNSMGIEGSKFANGNFTVEKMVFEHQKLYMSI